MGTLTIPNGTAVSNAIDAYAYNGALAIAILAPATLTNTVSVEAADSDTAPNYRTVQSPPGTDLTVPAGKCIVVTAFPWPGFRLKSAANEGAARDFIVYAQMARR